jgi:hypothetical protein
LTPKRAIASIRWSDLRLLPNASVRDLWSRKDLGQFTGGYSVEIPPHGSMLIKVSGTSGENSL